MRTEKGFQRPAREPDVHELLTQRQINEAIIAWCVKHGRLKSTDYEAVLLSSILEAEPEKSTMRVEAWLKP